MNLKHVADSINQEFADRNPIRIGGRYTDKNGRPVEVVSGQFMGTHGISNHWSWRLVKKDGTLGTRVYHGYGRELN